MIAPSPRIVHEHDVLPALRELFSQHPILKQSGCETLSRALLVLHFLPYRPEPFAVETALQALLIEGEALA